MSGEDLPLLLTVEEAGAVLRIGRTKAYAMTREWRETGGRSGLPVVDLGHVLRVPRHALEELIGAELPQTVGIAEVGANDDVAPPAEPVEAGSSDSRRDTTRQRRSTSDRTRPNRSRLRSQLDFFDSRSG